MLLTMAHHSLFRQMEHNRIAQQASKSNQTHFDYIIVGGGTAGCVLAHRISSRLNATVLLLEAGGPQSIVTDMIGNTQYLIGGEFDWNYNVQPQRYAGLAYPSFSITRGKVLGGSSTTQWGIYNRGNSRDYDNWSERYGLRELAWNEALNYFERFENNTDRLVSFENDPKNRSNGLVSISTETKPDLLLIKFQQLMNKLGFPNIDLSNGTNQLGTTIAQMFYNDQTAIKSSTATSYLESQSRNNKLTILTRSKVRRILFDENRRAIGVIYSDKNGQRLVQYARREIILSSGPINTPQILMLSGIGPSDHLNEIGIPVLRELPVGENLHDMVFVPLYYRIENRSLINPYPRFDALNLFEYFQNHNGPLAHHGDGVTYFSSTKTLNKQWPDTMIITVVEFFNDLNGTVNQFREHREQWQEYWRPYADEGYYLAVDPVLARPRSRGTVRLNPDNIEGPPLIDPNYLANSDDFEALLEVTKFVVKALQNHPLESVSMFPSIPGCTIPCVTEHLCETYLRCHIRKLARSYYNFAGTARMGLESDPQTVVGPNFNVLGFTNLRVIDASLMPEIPNGHIIAPTIMLAEKGSDVIINDALNVRNFE
ncbi:YEATS domain-containing protein 4 [Sarcoptes scabiei]|nr:YEATS domain-containing protein 4 [Sarcoptes scabiei]